MRTLNLLPYSIGARRIITAAALLLLAPAARATILEPDNIIYGQIAIGVNLIGGASTNFIVEAQRLDGTPVASYRMGDNPDYGGRYVLAVPLESVVPVPPSSTLAMLYENTDVLNPFASPAGTSLRLVVKEGRRRIIGGVATTTYTNHYTTNIVIGARATVQIVNFGNVTDSNNDGLPDAWQNLYGLTGNGAGDTDGDGVSDCNEYIAGTHPRDPNSVFHLRITNDVSQASVFFAAAKAEGPGYEGRTRYYTLESNTDNLARTGWTDVASYVDVPASNQTVLYSLVSTNTSHQFFRVRVRLSGP